MSNLNDLKAALDNYSVNVESSLEEEDYALAFGYIRDSIFLINRFLTKNYCSIDKKTGRLATDLLAHITILKKACGSACENDDVAYIDCIREDVERYRSLLNSSLEKLVEKHESSKTS